MKLEVFARHFDLLVNAPGSVARLRELVLQFAVQGKLVPQDSNEEPASALLNRIKAERDNLIAQGKVREPKILPPISIDEAPFAVPQGWVWSRLGFIAYSHVGKTPSTKNPAYWSEGDAGHSWTSIADMPDGGTVRATRRKVSDLAVRDVFKEAPVEAGVLLMSFKLTLGKVAYTGIPTYHNEAIVAVRPFTGVSQALLFRVLPVLVVHGASKNAIKGKTLNASSLSLLPVPLPPIEEQARIVSSVDELMLLCDDLETKLKQADAEAEKLLAATVHHMTEAS
jgi:type I restriction enzyme S subunit